LRPGFGGGSLSHLAGVLEEGELDHDQDEQKKQGSGHTNSALPRSSNRRRRPLGYSTR